MVSGRCVVFYCRILPSFHSNWSKVKTSVKHYLTDILQVQFKIIILLGYKCYSLRKHPFLFALRRWACFVWNVPSGEEQGETDVFAGYKCYRYMYSVHLYTELSPFIYLYFRQLFWSLRYKIPSSKMSTCVQLESFVGFKDVGSNFYLYDTDTFCNAETCFSIPLMSTHLMRFDYMVG